MEDFYTKCLTSNSDSVCYLGYFFLLFELLLLGFNIYAFIKMTRYYKKMNFENTIILLSAIQSIVLLIQILTSKYYFISNFLFIQILVMFLINNKFRKISIGYINIKYAYINTLILAINITYFAIYNVIYVIILSNSDNHFINNLDPEKNFKLNIFYYILEICASFFLAYHCLIFLGFIKEGGTNATKDPNTNSNDKIKDNKGNEKKALAKRKSLEFLGINMIGDGLFYLIKRKQLSLLFIGNLICSFLEFLFDIIINFMDSENDAFYFLRYMYDFIFFIQNSIIFISFYWLIRDQYSSIKESHFTKSVEKIENLIDDKYIEEEENSIKGENKRISVYLNDDKNLYKKTSLESNGDDEKNKRKEIKGKESAKRKVSRSSTFDENEEINDGPDVINIEDIPIN